METAVCLIPSSYVIHWFLLLYEHSHESNKLEHVLFLDGVIKQFHDRLALSAAGAGAKHFQLLVTVQAVIKFSIRGNNSEVSK